MTMSKEEFEEEYGKTKLDHVLSYIVIYFMKALEFLLIVATPVGILYQVCLYGEKNPDQVVSLLVVLMIIVSAYGIKLVKEVRGK